MKQLRSEIPAHVESTVATQMEEFVFLPFEPPRELKPLLRTSFYARGRIPYRYDKILPNGLAVAIFCLGAPHRLGKSEVPEENALFERGWVHGVQTSPVFNAPTGETHVLGLLFEPPGLYRISGRDMTTLTERTAEAAAVLAPDLLLEIEAHFTHPDSVRTHARLHDWLHSHVQDTVPAWLARLYGEIRTTRGDIALSDAYASTGHSARHVIAQFKRAVGVSPKVLARIYRLEALLARIDPAGSINWAELAHGSGFYDQSHFNREFRRLSGLTPAEYLRERRRELPQLGRGDHVSFVPQR